MEKILKLIDINQTIGEVTLSNGSVLPLPKISMDKIFKLAHFICTEGSGIYNSVQEIMSMTELSAMERFAAVLSALDPKQIVRLHAIVLGISAEEAVSLDLDETLEILVEYFENTDLGKTYSLIQRLAKTFNKELPDWDKLWETLIPEVEELEQPGQIS
ncbi:hypothetical protein bcere0016_55890 [Bacillus cereus 95/8201]|uniref:hypothetical protein n=1 Tax=Bacillus cereus TaxID=1396 RepID=UPI0001A08F8F|nr:hypothetical protein [Bacillus cereus]EEL13859.1 hypothetical protein bcere0016_55890 [Bacillus cereus 95/8201]